MYLNHLISGDEKAFQHTTCLGHEFFLPAILSPDGPGKTTS